jgi:hypothetical protein
MNPHSGSESPPSVHESQALKLIDRLEEIAWLDKAEQALTASLQPLVSAGEKPESWISFTDGGSVIPSTPR